MKKLIVLFAILFLFSGCSVKDISKEDINKEIAETLNYKTQGANHYFKGYKYYLPRGFTIEDKKGNNHKLHSKGDYYYLYVDIVSYFHKKEIQTTFDNELYFSEKISYNGIEGYVKIKDKEDDLYYIEIVYNYSKMEAYVKEENLIYALQNSIRMLASIEYNDVILDTLIGEKTLDYQEEIFDFFESKREEGNFLDYIEEYDAYDKEDKIKDEDFLDSIDE
jgi:hypothetical protein